MKFNKYLICALFLVLICCIGAASAADAGDDAVAANDTIDEVVSEAADVSDEIDEEPLGVSEEPALSEGETGSGDENELVIYVGQNKTEDGGNGSYENPFNTLNLAHDYANNYNKSKTTINIFEGTYYLDKIIKFNTSNLYIRGINGSVIIKNMYDPDNNANIYMGIGLISDSSNFTMSNLIYDATEYRTGIIDSLTGFSLFDGTANFGVFENCSFLGLSSTRLDGLGFDSNFINCYFEGTSSKVIFRDNFKMNGNYYFKNCIFNLPNAPRLGSSNMYIPCNITFEDVWFGQNNIPSYMTPNKRYVRDKDNKQIDGYSIPITRYAKFSVYENYKGNNTYEIIGKLTWNGTENQESMENFQPMTVKLSSYTGNISETAILTNGTFKAIYTSNSSEHKVVATLHNQPIEVIFNSIDFTVDAPSILYGEDQNITVTFPQVITNNITITVNNKTYDVEVINTNSTTFTIEDRLTEGNYTVDVLYIDEVNKVYGSNSTILSVSRVSDYTFNPEINDNGDIKVGDELTITVELPIDVSGNVTVKVNDNPVITKEATPNTVITINNLVSGNNNITIAYTGNDKYVAKTTEPQVVTAQKVVIPEDEIRLVIENSSTPNVSIKLPEYVTGKLIVYVDGTPFSKELVNGSANITVPDQEPGNHNISAEFTGDEKYQGFKSDNTTFNVPKISVPGGENALNMTTPANSATPTYSINLPNATGNLTVIVDGKDKYTKELENGSATITLPELSSGKHEITVTYSGDNKYESVSKTTTVNVPAKSTPAKTPVAKKAATKITAKKKTFKAKTKVKKYTITLKSGKKPVKKVYVTIKIGKKTFKAKTNAKGKATFKIKKLTKKGKYNAVIKFKGNKNYKATSKKVKITIKK